MIVAIVGRPNVGKSTIFNRIVGKRISIVHHTPGVTRDRVFAYGEWQGKVFGVFDTGGFWPEQNILFREIVDQIKLATEEANLIVFVLDAKTGVLPLDEDLYRLVRKMGKEIILVINKVDNPGSPPETIYNIPFKENPILLSATQGFGFTDLLVEIAQRVKISEPSKGDSLRILILGRPNVGKSTLLNKLAGKKRAVVEPNPGTTRDPLSEFITYQGKKIELIDTAGIRRKSRVKKDIEFFSVLRALRMIPAADLAVLLFDAVEGPVKQDLRLLDLVLIRGKGFVVCANKIDLLNQEKKRRIIIETKRFFGFLPNCPVVAIAAKTNLNLDKLLSMSINIFEQGIKRIEEGVLKQIINEIPPPPGKNRIFKIKQIDTAPPVFEIRVRNRLPLQYVKFLKRKLREYFSFQGQPIIIKERCRT